ncbi:MAG TPA: RagB/SusD family nutrient uptake outer membrane protein [Paludibacter sp.]|nr:RagB/SusD family nutrient uptake outer membrane protein [Paludibacter sp.]
MKKTILIITILLVPVLSSCEMLDLEPKDQISQFDYFKNATDLELFSNPFYNNLLDKSPFDEQSDIIVEAILTDVLTGGNRRTVPASGGGWSWGTLRRINTLLEHVDNCEDKDAVVKYTAISRFFRAYFYFDKVVRFGDVPWYDKQLGSADEDLYKPRDSRELIMSKMIEDIDFAIENLPAGKSTYRVNKWAALALKSRFCLFEGTYRKYHNISLEGNDYKYYLNQSVAAAKEIIDNSPYKLYSTENPTKDYLMLFAQKNADADEYILAIKFDYALGIRHNASAYTLVTTQGRPGLTRKFVNSYLMKDGSRFTDKAGWQEMSFLEETSNRDPRLAQSMRTPGYTRINQTQVLAPDLNLAVTGYQSIKFVQDPKSNSSNNDRTGSSDCDMPVFRLAEVFLNYAEAKAELGTLTQEDLDISINKLRKRVDMPDMNMAAANSTPDVNYLGSETYGYPNVSGANKGVILEIRRERTIELLQEGFRLSDLYRWKAGKAIDQSFMGMYFAGAGEYDLTGDGKADIVLYPKDTPKPPAQEGVVPFELEKDIFLSNVTSGYIDFHQKVERNGFNEQRDYLYPIPIDERTLNNNLTQNPGWNDGLNF